MRNIFLVLMCLAIGVLVSCSPAEKPEVAASPQKIKNITWRLEDLNNTGIIDNSHLTMMFDDMGKVGGASGCNGYSANYQLENNVLKVYPGMITTNEKCPEALMIQEERFKELLQAGTSILFDKTEALIITTKDQRTLTFRKDY